MNIREEIGEAIYLARVKKRFTQEEVSKGAGLAPGQLSLIERGLSNFTIDTLQKINDFFGGKLVNVLDVDDEAKPEKRLT
jgi:transcriptional regulator with XRE-family HTH domain